MISRYSRGALTLLMSALYGGAVVAGMAGHPLRVLPVYAALFLLYIAATRKPDLSNGVGWAGLVMMAGVQLVLVGLCFGAGGALAWLIGSLQVPLWAPMLVTATAAGIGAWQFRDAAEMDVMLDSVLDSLAELERASPDIDADPWPTQSPEVIAAVERALSDLRALETVTVGHVDAIVQQLETDAGVAAFDEFYENAALDEDADTAAVDYGLLRFMASPNIRRQLVEFGEAGMAPSLLMDSPHARVRSEAIGRVLDLLDDANAEDQLPDPGWLDDLHAMYPDEGFDDLKEKCARG